MITLGLARWSRNTGRSPVLYFQRSFLLSSFLLVRQFYDHINDLYLYYVRTWQLWARLATKCFRTQRISISWSVVLINLFEFLFSCSPSRFTRRVFTGNVDSDRPTTWPPPQTIPLTLRAFNPLTRRAFQRGLSNTGTIRSRRVSRKSLTPTYRMLPTLVSLLPRSLPRSKSSNNSTISVSRTHTKLKYNCGTKTRA